MRAPDLESGTSARRATLAVNKQRGEWDIRHEKLVGEEFAVREIYRVASLCRCSGSKKDDGSQNTPLEHCCEQPLDDSEKIVITLHRHIMKPSKNRYAIGDVLRQYRR